MPDPIATHANPSWEEALKAATMGHDESALFPDLSGGAQEPTINLRTPKM